MVPPPPAMTIHDRSYEPPVWAEAGAADRRHAGTAIVTYTQIDKHVFGVHRMISPHVCQWPICTTPPPLLTSSTGLLIVKFPG